MALKAARGDFPVTLPYFHRHVAADHVAVSLYKRAYALRVFPFHKNPPKTPASGVMRLVYSPETKNKLIL